MCLLCLKLWLLSKLCPQVMQSALCFCAQSVEWEFAVIHSPEPNAFVAPGGKVSILGPSSFIICVLLNLFSELYCTWSLASLLSTQQGNVSRDLGLIDHQEQNARWCALEMQVVVYTALLELLSSEEELVAVLAHETAHVLARHTVSGQ